MKAFNPIVLSPRSFAKFFPLSAVHFNINPEDYGEVKEIVLVQMTQRDVFLFAISRILQDDNSDSHQFELYRTMQTKTEHLATFIAVNITHPQPCVILDSVDFKTHNDPQNAALDLTMMADNGLQDIYYKRALRYSLFFTNIVATLGKKPEEAKWHNDSHDQAMRLLCLPEARLREHIEETLLPPDYPKKGEVILKKVPRAFKLESLLEPGEVAFIEAQLNQKQPNILPLRPAPADAQPLGGQGGTVVSLDQFRNKAPKLS